MMQDEIIKKVAFSDKERAERVLQSLINALGSVEAAEPLLVSLEKTLQKSPDADMGFNNFERWFASLSSKMMFSRFLTEHQILLDIIMLVFSTSQYLSDILVQNPEIVEILADPSLRVAPKSPADYTREIQTMVTPGKNFLLQLDRLRHFKQRELVRIGSMDIAGFWDVRRVTSALSYFADACVQTAYELCHAELSAKYSMQGEPGLAVIAMGKLGGNELNYSSDIDLVFVNSDDDKMTGSINTDQYRTKLAEAIVNAISGQMTRGFVFRVDLRLRPEGRFGVITRSLESCRNYYESWAETWEYQALIKARPCAGDLEVANAFIKMTQPYVFRRFVPEKAIDEIRVNKNRMEERTQGEGEWETNIKNGFGGIRDIEFSAQLLQVVHGGRRPNIRSGSTLTALERLASESLIVADDAEAMADHYCFLRNVEHRLQILYELQTYSLPDDPQKVEKLARRMGFETRDAFILELNRRRAEVRSCFEKYFYGQIFEKKTYNSEWISLLDNIQTEKVKDELLGKLKLSGFSEPEATVHLLKIPIFGSENGLSDPITRKEFLEIAPDLMNLAEHSPNPDGLIAMVEMLATEVPNRAQLYQTFQESPEVMRRLTELAVYSPKFYKFLVRHQELIDMLFSDEILEEGPRPVHEYLEILHSRIALNKRSLGKLNAIVNYTRRELVRLAVRFIWKEADLLETTGDLSNLAYALSSAILDYAYFVNEIENNGEMTIIGMGKMGGRELGFGSDWDVVFLHDDNFDTDKAATIAKSWLNTGNELKAQGFIAGVDARLRPEGGSGVLSRSLSGMESYYNQTAELWERQALIKANYVAGSLTLWGKYKQIIDEFVYSKSITSEQEDEIRQMKYRVENERLKENQIYTDVKLGWGGLSDIEFLTQMLQLKYGEDFVSLRNSNNLSVIKVMRDEGIINLADFMGLDSAFRYLTNLRNYIHLLSDTAGNILPGDEVRLRVISRAMGYSIVQLFNENHNNTMKETRKIFERLFLGKTH